MGPNMKINIIIVSYSAMCKRIITSGCGQKVYHMPPPPPSLKHICSPMEVYGRGTCMHAIWTVTLYKVAAH